MRGRQFEIIDGLVQNLRSPGLQSRDRAAWPFLFSSRAIPNAGLGIEIFLFLKAGFAEILVGQQFPSVVFSRSPRVIMFIFLGSAASDGQFEIRNRHFQDLCFGGPMRFSFLVIDHDAGTGQVLAEQFGLCMIGVRFEDRLDAGKRLVVFALVFVTGRPGSAGPVDVGGFDLGQFLVVVEGGLVMAARSSE